jgi:D-hydroxyproline dehydrogenase subunit beta
MMQHERTADAVVVGAGIIGAAVAWYLARDGMSVLVLESGFPGGGTTAGGMGHIVVMDDSPAQAALTLRSRTLLDEVIEELPASCEYERAGTLWLAEDDAQLEAARTKQVYYADLGVGAELLDARQTLDAEPAVRADLAGALRVPDDGVVYPPALAHWLLAQAEQHGARVRRNVRIAAIDDGVVTTDGERIDAGVIVNAAGIAAAALSPGLDIIPRKGHLVITDRYPSFCRHQLVELGYLQSAHSLTAASVAFNLQPRRTGQVLIGSSRELVGSDARVNRSVVAQMLARAVHFTPRLARLSALRTWTAFRPATRDHLPYIGAWPAQRNVWIGAGHEGLGITTALATGELLADLITGRATRIDAAPYAPARAFAAES